MSETMKRLDIKKIRKKLKLSQQRLSEITEYNQGFISLMENGKALVPAKFVALIKDRLNIEDLTPYYMEVIEDGTEKATEGLPSEQSSVAKEIPGSTESMPSATIVERFLTIIERQNKKIEELEAQIRHLEQNRQH